MLMPVPQHGLSLDSATAALCSARSWLHPSTFVPKQVQVGLQGTMKTYLEVLGSQLSYVSQLVKAHVLALSDLISQAVVLSLFIPSAGVWTFSVANKPHGEKLAFLKCLSAPLRSSS